MGNFSQDYEAILNFLCHMKYDTKFEMICKSFIFNIIIYLTLLYAEPRRFTDLRDVNIFIFMKIVVLRSP